MGKKKKAINNLNDKLTPKATVAKVITSLIK